MHVPVDRGPCFQGYHSWCVAEEPHRHVMLWPHVLAPQPHVAVSAPVSATRPAWVCHADIIANPAVCCVLGRLDCRGVFIAAHTPAALPHLPHVHNSAPAAGMLPY